MKPSAPFGSWDERAAGRGCPFDAPRPDAGEHWDKIGSLGVSTLYLHKIQACRGYSLLIFDRGHATKLTNLPQPDARAFMEDLRRALLAIETVVRPDAARFAPDGHPVSGGPLLPQAARPWN